MMDAQSEVAGYAAHYAREQARKEGERRLWLTLDLLVHRLTVERDIRRDEGEEDWSLGMDRAIEILTISRDAHAVVD